MNKEFYLKTLFISGLLVLSYPFWGEYSFMKSWLSNPFGEDYFLTIFWIWVHFVFFLIGILMCGIAVYLNKKLS